ncbi:MAG: ABC transporter permease [Eubacteriales bacterium]|nr:ABC transporter permease [Eubacteriales bacterium]
MKKINRRTALFIFTLVMLGLLLAIYICGIVISEEAVAGSFLNAKIAPQWRFPFGTDALGRNLLLRTLKGLSVSMTVGLIASLISAVIAVLVGIVAATGSKWMDAAINWLIDLVMSVPHTVLVILISFSLGKGMKGLIVGIAATHWCSLARLIRAEVLQLRSEQYVLVSRKLGKSGFWILIHHLLPHLLPQFLVGLILLFPHAILHEASASFLGFGLSPDKPAIGIILSESMRYLSTGMWWPAVLPGVTLVLIVFLVDKVGEQLRKILSPHSAQE